MVCGPWYYYTMVWTVSVEKIEGHTRAALLQRKPGNVSVSRGVIPRCRYVATTMHHVRVSSCIEQSAYCGRVHRYLLISNRVINKNVRSNHFDPRSILQGLGSSCLLRTRPPTEGAPILCACEMPNSDEDVFFPSPPSGQDLTNFSAIGRYVATSKIRPHQSWASSMHIRSVSSKWVSEFEANTKLKLL